MFALCMRSPVASQTNGSNKRVIAELPQSTTELIKRQQEWPMLTLTGLIDVAFKLIRDMAMATILSHSMNAE